MRKLTTQERIIFEQYFPYKNMSIEEGDKYLNILFNSTLLSDYFFDKQNETESEMVLMSLDKIGISTIEFDGAYAVIDKSNNKSENRTVKGSIKDLDGIIIIEADIDRLGVRTLDNEIFTYHLLDVLRFNENGSFRLTSKVGFDLKLETIEANRENISADEFDKLVLKRTMRNN